VNHIDTDALDVVKVAEKSERETLRKLTRVLHTEMDD
jgi:hypothetical protein